MKERPVLMSAPMVRALLDGSKTQTRRVVKPQPERRSIADVGSMLGFKKRHGEGFWLWPNAKDRIIAECPYGQPGDRLWVRETWGYIDPDCSGEQYENEDGGQGPVTFAKELMQDGHPLRNFWLRRVAYAATWQEPKFGNGPDVPARWRPSIHMPRWASRITLEITKVRVERLQDISEADAVAEGVYTDPACPAYDAYAALWEQLNGPGSWAANPWVWVIEFKRLNAAGAPA